MKREEPTGNEQCGHGMPRKTQKTLTSMFICQNVTNKSPKKKSNHNSWFKLVCVNHKPVKSMNS